MFKFLDLFHCKKCTQVSKQLKNKDAHRGAGGERGRRGRRGRRGAPHVPPQKTSENWVIKMK
jgi:hypothetical protein